MAGDRNGAVLVLVEQQLLPAALPGTAQYTAPPAVGTRVEVRMLRVTNPTAGALAFSLHEVPSGQTPVAANLAFGATSIPANTTWELTYEPEEWVLTAGTGLFAFGSAATLGFKLSGVRFS